MQKICVNCVMDTSDPNITFDERGVCHHCRTFYEEVKPAWHPDEQGRRELDVMLDRIRESGKGKQFDCIIGISGGLDSSYLAYLAKMEFGLRPLVFHVDAGWDSELAVYNIERLLDVLQLELFTEVIDWDEMRDLQLAFFKASIPHIDTPQDHAFFAAMYKFAQQYDVKWILTGGNYATECVNNPIEWMYYQSDLTQLRDIHRRFGTRPLKTFPTTNILRHKLLLPYVKGIRTIRPLNFVPYTKKDASALLVEKVGYQTYSRKHFESRFTSFYEGFWLYRKFGYDTRRVQLSSLILTGQTTRDAALEELKRPPLDDDTARREFAYVADKLNISEQELQSYLEAPNRTFRDYKSQAWLYDLGGKISRMVSFEPGGARK
jgi:N-acetyl sugar amidotransferase